VPIRVWVIKAVITVKVNIRITVTTCSWARTDMIQLNWMSKATVPDLLCIYWVYAKQKCDCFIQIITWFILTRDAPIIGR